MKKENRHTEIDWVTVFLCILSGFASLALLGWSLNNSHRGIDFTDESFYLVSMATPYLYDWGVSQFGFFYHPIFKFFDGDIVRLRQFNILVIFGLSWYLTFLLLQNLSGAKSSSVQTKVIVAAGVATASLIFFSSWLVTPSYNSLTFKGLLVTSIGVFLIDTSKINERSRVYGGTWIGIGGWMVFMAKPNVAALLAIFVLVCLVWTYRCSIRVLLYSTISACVLLLLSIFFIDGSLTRFFDRLQTGLVFGYYLGGGHSFERMFRLDDFLLTDREKDACFIVFLGSCIATILLWFRRPVSDFLSLFFPVLCFLVVCVLVMASTQWVPGFEVFQSLTVFGVVFFLLLLGFVACFGRHGGKGVLKKFGFVFFFLLLPYVYAFGSNGNYWVISGFVAFFWILGGLSLASGFYEKNGWGFSLPFVLATQAVTAVLLQTGMEQPYRQNQALRLNNHVIEFGAHNSFLVLSENYFQFLDDIKNNAIDAGFSPGTAVFDLTGQSPGVLYAMQALSLGQAWVIGGYPGSLHLAKEALKRVSCEKIAQAWLLTEPEGPRSIGIDAILNQGGRFPEGYEKVATWMTAEGAGGYPQKRKQVLYKPIEEQQVLAMCKKLRAE